jgi:hypothetical protein
MKKITIEQQLIGTEPAETKDYEDFIAHTMRAVRRAASDETFRSALRTTNEPKQGTIRMKLQNIKLAFMRLPRYVAVLILVGGTSTVGATAYVAYKWITPKVTITNIKQSNDENKKEYTIDSQCGEYNSGSNLKYELSKNSSINDEEALKVFQNTCAYDALSSFIDAHWKSDNTEADMAKKKVGDLVTIYNHDNTFAGSDYSNPIFGITIGTVNSISPSEVSFSLPVYAIDNSAAVNPSVAPVAYYPEGKTLSRTLSLASDVEVWTDGKRLKLADVHVGDQIQVVTRTQNYVQYYDDIKQNALGAQKTFDVVGIIKTAIDTRYVADGSAQIGDPKITNALAGVGPCVNNPDYSCVLIPHQVLGPVYGAGDLEGDSKDNTKYLRKDVLSKDVATYVLHGRITSIDHAHITLETRGKKTTFTVDLPYDSVATYNQAKPVTSDADKSRALGVAVGDLMEVMYTQKPSENHLAIKPADIQSFAVLEQIQPDGSLLKY